MNSQCKKGSVWKIFFLTDNFFVQGELSQCSAVLGSVQIHNWLVITSQDRQWEGERRR